MLYFITTYLIGNYDLFFTIHLTSFNKKAPNLTVRCQNKNVTLKKRISQCKDSHFPLIKETPE